MIVTHSNLFGSSMLLSASGAPCRKLANTMIHWLITPTSCALWSCFLLYMKEMQQCRQRRRLPLRGAMLLVSKPKHWAATQ